MDVKHTFMHIVTHKSGSHFTTEISRLRRLSDLLSSTEQYIIYITHHAYQICIYKLHNHTH